jgi:ABC-type nitrate/sulfonate/bicarbonate transport system permease component
MSDDVNVASLVAGARPELLAARRGGDGGRVSRALSGVAWGLFGILILLVIWRGYLYVFSVDHFIGRTPTDVFKALFTADDAGANRSLLFHHSLTTLRDATIGLVIGTVVALAGAILFTLVKPVQQTFMPMALVLQSVPLVALTPLIGSIFGGGLMTIAIVASIVTFFPTLVNVTIALREVPGQSIDLMRAYGATRSVTLRKVQFPSALPALFASLRIGAPRALVGALLAEFLITEQGLGGDMLHTMTNFQLDVLWAAVALVTLYSIILYNAISAVERSVLERYAPNALGGR